MLLKPIEFKISTIGEIENGYSQTLAKEGISFKVDDIELEVMSSESDSPIKRVVLGKNVEVKAIMIDNVWAQTPANELLSFNYGVNLRNDNFLTNSLEVAF